MKIAAVLLALTGALIGTGAALEFAYFGPGTPQFLAGVVGTPAGVLMIAAASALWRFGARASRFVRVAAVAMLGATLVCTLIDVMGPPAMLAGTVGGLVGLDVARRARLR